MMQIWKASSQFDLTKRTGQNLVVTVCNALTSDRHFAVGPRGLDTDGLECLHLDV